MARNPKSERMLPGDYSRKVKYDSLDNTQKRIKHGGEDALKLLHFPEDLRGEQFKERPFLVFYFDDADDYMTALGTGSPHGKPPVFQDNRFTVPDFSPGAAFQALPGNGR